MIKPLRNYVVTIPAFKTSKEIRNALKWRPIALVFKVLAGGNIPPYLITDLCSTINIFPQNCSRKKVTLVQKVQSVYFSILHFSLSN
jgi:hypothetical protein